MGGIIDISTHLSRLGLNIWRVDRYRSNNRDFVPIRNLGLTLIACISLLHLCIIYNIWVLFERELSECSAVEVFSVM